ncbi:MAG: hypothetical protein ACREO8_13575 [Luteimonas sp.]
MNRYLRPPKNHLLSNAVKNAIAALPAATTLCLLLIPLSIVSAQSPTARTPVTGAKPEPFTLRFPFPLPFPFPLLDSFDRRGDIRALPAPLKNRLRLIDRRPQTYPPMTAFSEADSPSQLFQYYLLDTNNFQPNVFTSVVPGINDTAIATGANAANDGLPTIGAVRVTLEPKPGLPTDPDNPGAFIDIFTDVSGLFVINNESGWYEGWMISDVRVPRVAPPRADGHALFGRITAEDLAIIRALGTGNNAPGNFFTFDGNAPHFGGPGDVFPNGRQSNILPHPVSMGAYNALQQSDVHSYWEFNAGTNWIFPHYELPFTAGVPTTFEGGLQYLVNSLVPGSGPEGVLNDELPNKLVYGDNPNDPRDPDRTEAENPDDLEFRNRFIPSALDQEVLLSAFVRRASFRPDIPADTPANLGQRLLLAYAQEIARVDQNGDGVISFEEADLDGTSDGVSNRRLYLRPRDFNRFAITREINDGLLAPRFAPSQRAYVASGSLVTVSPAVPASVPRDADNR